MIKEGPFTGTSVRPGLESRVPGPGAAGTEHWRTDIQVWFILTCIRCFIRMLLFGSLCEYRRLLSFMLS